jgi:hypothetical protein
MSAKQKTLHERGLQLSNLIQLEASRVHVAFGKKMFVYATEILGMDAPFACSYISIARACVKFPALRPEPGFEYNGRFLPTSFPVPHGHVNVCIDVAVRWKEVTPRVREQEKTPNFQAA